MSHYTPPLRDMQFVLHEVLDVAGTLKTLPRHADVDVETIDAVIEQAGKFAAEVVAPLNGPGDAQGCTLDKTTHEVRTPDGFRDAYAQYVAGGWPALSGKNQRPAVNALPGGKSLRHDKLNSRSASRRARSSL